MFARWVTGSTIVVLAAVAGGCQPNGGGEGERVEPFRGVDLAVTAIGDPAILPIVAARLGEWESSRGGTTRIVPGSVDPTTAASADVLVFPGQLLGDLIDVGALRSLPESLVETPSTAGPTEESTATEVEDPLDYIGVIEPYREAVARYGPDRQGLALGGSALVLVYRPEALKAAAEGSKPEIEEKPPTTWEELDALAAALDGRDWDGDGSADAGLALAVGDDPERLAVELFLARAASSALHPDFFSFLFDTGMMKPALESPPFLEATEGLVRLAKTGPDEAIADSEAARACFRRGETAFLIDRAEHVAEWGEEGSTRAIGVAPLPGSARIYNPDRRSWEPAKLGLNRPTYLPLGGGWLMGVSAASKHPEAAEDLVRYLIESETAAAVRADPSYAMLPVRGALIGIGPNSAAKAPGLDRRAWADAVSRTLLADRVAVGLRIPDADGYLADLDAAIRKALAGTDPAEALKSAADDWEARTDRLGRDRQLWHLRRSLLGFATDPEPPARPRGPG